jgi:predicted XRE-type DNA-binding protein
VEAQLSLLGVMKPVVQPVDDSVIRIQPNFLQAIRLAIQSSGLEDKQIYSPLGIDKATWSKILDGQFSFPTNKYEQLFDLIKNEIPLVWLAFRRGYILMPLRDAKDRRIVELEAEIADLKAKDAAWEKVCKALRT